MLKIKAEWTLKLNSEVEENNPKKKPKKVYIQKGNIGSIERDEVLPPLD